MIYLDNAATTYPKPDCVYRRAEEAIHSAFNSGRGSYKVAKEKLKTINETRERILKLNNINNGVVVFTPSATYALNQIAFGLELNEGDNVYVSPFEHNAIMRPLEEIRKRKKINIVEIPFDNETFELNEKELKSLFAIKKPKAVFCIQISNVIGLLVDYEKIFKESIKYNAINVLDASQGYGIVKLKEKENISFTVFAGHKSLYAVFGVAGYIVHGKQKLNQFLFGGTGSDSLNLNVDNSFPNGFEAGSPNIVAIEALHESTKWLMNTDVYTNEKKMTEFIINELQKIKTIKLYLPNEISKIFGIVAFNHKDYQSDELGEILSEDYDIYVRTGFHCAPLIHKFLDTEKIGGVCRMSIGYFSQFNEINKVIQCINGI